MVKNVEVRRGFLRHTRREGRLAVHVGSLWGHGTRCSLSVEVQDTVRRHQQDREPGRVRLQATLHGPEVAQIAGQLVGQSTLDYQFGQSVERAVEFHRVGAVEAERYWLGRATGLAMALRLIETTGNDEVGGNEADRARVKREFEQRLERAAAREETLRRVAQDLAGAR